MAGKKATFSPDENFILRAALRRFVADRKLTQEALGDLLGMTQQNSNRLLATNEASPGGMGRDTANALARALGYRDAEQFLLDTTVTTALAEQTTGDSSDREVAVMIARRLGYEERAIDAVTARYSASETRGRPLKWWITKFGDEERELAADALRAPPRTPEKPTRPTTKRR